MYCSQARTGIGLKMELPVLMTEHIAKDSQDDYKKQTNTYV